jgi:hypothetical protein
LESMLETLQVHHVVTLADLHQMIGAPVPNTDHRLGWEHLGRARVFQNRDGYVLSLPQVISI